MSAFGLRVLGLSADASARPIAIVAARAHSIYRRSRPEKHLSAETMASMYRKKREAALADTLSRKIVDSFQRDWESFIRVEVNSELNGYIDRVVKAYPLRGFDAIHLASAIVIHEKCAEDFIFACFDEALVRAAQSEGFETFPS